METSGELVLLREEYEEIPEGVKTLVETVIKKLPGPQRKKYEPLHLQQQALRKEAECVQHGVDAAILAAWVNLNAGQNAHGRGYGVVYRLLADLEILITQYGVEAVNAALLKVVGMGDPAKATLAYLTAIVKRGGAVVAAPAPAPKAAPSVGTGWEGIQGQIKQRMTVNTYRTWIAPLTCRVLTSTSLIVCCPSDVHVQYVQNNFAQAFRDAFRAVQGAEPAVLLFEEGGEDYASSINC